MGVFCTNCGTPLPEEAVFCPKCGAKFEMPHCPACGKTLDFGADFCIYCGQRLKEEPPEPEREDPVPPAKPTSSPEPEREETAPPAEADLAPDDQVFNWSYMARQSEDYIIHTITMKLQEKTLHISQELSSMLEKTWHQSLPEQVIDLNEIEDLAVDSEEIIIFQKSGRMVKFEGKDPEILGDTAAAILLQLQRIPGGSETPSSVARPETGYVPPADTMPKIDSVGAPKKKKRGWLIAGAILGMIVLVIGGIEVYQRLYVRDSFPNSVMQDPNVREYVSTEINGDLDYLVTAEVTGGRLVKETSLPQRENGMLTYLFVDYVYDVTLSDDFGESASGQVTVNCSFETEPSVTKPKDIILNSFTYSDELENFINTREVSLPDDLPLDFSLSSGAGAWNTSLTLNRDGSFSGGYSDMDMGVSPTIYTSTFRGTFSRIRRVNYYVYSMMLSELEMEETPGEEWYSESGALMIATEPMGVDLGGTYLLYTPEAPFSVLPPFALSLWGDSAKGRYVLCKEKEENGFLSEALTGV